MRSILIGLLATALVLTSCTKEEIVELESSKTTTERFLFNEPATGIEHLLEVRDNDTAELFVKSGECFRPTREGDFINVRLTFAYNVKEGVVYDLENVSNGKVVRIFIRIVGDIAEIPFNGSAIHAERAKQPWLLFKCND